MPPLKKKRKSKSPHRLSISLTEEHYAELTEIAEKNRVSIAWVVRKAIEKMLNDDVPLLRIGGD